MKKTLFLLSFFLFLVSAKVFSQTVYINETGECYHTNKCKLYGKSFEAVPLWKARETYGKRPCNKCNPPTKEVKTVAKKKSAPKARPKTTPATKK